MPKYKWQVMQVYDQVSEYLERQKETQEIIVLISNKETKEMRTLQQNNMYYWIFWEIEKQSPYSSETIKQYLLGRAFGKREVFWELENNQTQTSKLTKSEAREFIDAIIWFCEEHTLHIKYTSRDFESLINTY